MVRSGDDHKFTRIMDAIASMNQRVNIIGVVSETSIPKQSRGTDVFCLVKLVDESKGSPGIPVNFFTETMDLLPRVQFAGDIIIITGVLMQTYGEPFVVYNKKHSSFALFDGRHGSSFEPYQCSSTYKPRDEYKRSISDLREFLLKNPNIIGSHGSQSLREIILGDRFNLTSKIIHLSRVNREMSILYIWDGTDTPPLVIETKRLEDETSPLPLYLEPSAVPRDILSTFPTVGTVLRVFISQEHEKLDLSILQPGRWVKLASLKCEFHDSLWRAYLKPFTRLCYLRDDDGLVLQRQRDYDARAPSRWGRMPMSSYPWPAAKLTKIVHSEVPIVTLMDALTHKKVIGKFRCVVRVVGVYPWRPEYFRSPRGIYRMRLTIEDPTARLHAYLYEGDGETFFGGHRTPDVLRRMRDALLGIPESHEGSEAGVNPPWLHCCLVSYATDDADKWGSRNFRIFDTKMSGNFRNPKSQRLVKSSTAV